MKKNLRIKKRKDFVRVSKSNFSFRANSVVVLCNFNGLNTHRVGFTASKKIGNAVIRNLCKRRMRAAADIIFTKIGLAGIDYVLIARKSTDSVNWSLLVEEITHAVNFLNDKIL
ncbi:MAG: ribonuclease P protein component [Holosporaceae bacterium]|nr:ribonuclease P protein component [Holosporaceae bacterium]